MKLLILCLLVISVLCVPTLRPYDNDKVFKVFPENEEEVDMIKHLDSKKQVNFYYPKSLHRVVPNNPVTFHASANESKKHHISISAKRDYDRMWRKNRTPNNNCIGTDLNRNFNISWNKFEKDKGPCDEVYAGTGPESAVETQAFTAYIRKNLYSIKAYISFHSCGQMLLYPNGYTEEETPNHATLFASNCQVSGSSIDWAYSEGIKYSFGFELRDDFEYCFLLPEYQIKPTCKETMLAVKVISNYILGLDA
ncbi:mast cell carboxypeptidase A-like [Pelobates fuscus]|uniref:mast cell carboxypeptidase A-like n=1 Tax=Pelobates fuscus TaxID=191477 RepID=UPI002FE49E9E